jgi:hypothetical protein
MAAAPIAVPVAAQPAAASAPASASVAPAGFRPTRVELDSYAAHLSVGDWTTAWPALIKQFGKNASK